MHLKSVAATVFKEMCRCMAGVPEESSLLTTVPVNATSRIEIVEADTLFGGLHYHVPCDLEDEDEAVYFMGYIWISTIVRKCYTLKNAHIFT